MQKTWIQWLGWEDSKGEGMAIHSRILAWRIPMERGAWRARVHGVAKESDTTEQLSTTPQTKYMDKTQKTMKNNKQEYLN